MQEMGESIVRAAKLNVEAAALLGLLAKESGRLNAITEEIIRLEEQVDQLHGAASTSFKLTRTLSPSSSARKCTIISNRPWTGSRMSPTRSARS